MTILERNILIIALIILFFQSVWLFLDASKNNQNKWLWGFIGLLNFPSALLIYLLVTRLLNKKITCPNCLYTTAENSVYCSNCGHQITDKERKLGIEIFKKNEQKNR